MRNRNKRVVIAFMPSINLPAAKKKVNRICEWQFEAIIKTGQPDGLFFLRSKANHVYCIDGEEYRGKYIFIDNTRKGIIAVMAFDNFFMGLFWLLKIH